jgi:hypothetical protein
MVVVHCFLFKLRNNLILQVERKISLFYRNSNASGLPPLKGRESNAFEDQTVELGKRGMEIAELGKNNIIGFKRHSHFGMLNAAP